jgi:hypothetical protein
MARPAEIIAEFCSHTLPRHIGKRFPGLGDAMSSDQASWWPICFLVIGLGLGGFHLGYHNVLTESLILVSGVAALASFRIQWGTYFFIGLVVGDLCFFRTTYIFQTNRYYNYQNNIEWLARVAETGFATAIYYYLLSMIFYKIPLFCQNVARQSKYNPTAQSILNVGISGVLMYFWVLAYPVLIRPVWTWAHATPPVSAIMPIQLRGGWVVLAVVMAGIARAWWQRRSGQVAGGANSDFRLNQIPFLPKKVLLFVTPAVGTFLVSGLLMTWRDT